MREEQKGQGSQREEEAGSQNEHQEADESGKAAEAVANPERPASFDPLLRLRGSGRRIWGDEDPVEYVRRLRED